MVEGVRQIHRKKPRVSSLSLCWTLHRMVCTMASQPLLVPTTSCVGWRSRVTSSETVASRAFAVRRRRVSPTATGRWPPSFFFHCRCRGTRYPGDNGTWNVAFCHHVGSLISVASEQAPFDMLWAYARRSCCCVGGKGLKRERLGQSEEVSFKLCLPLEVVDGGLTSPWRLSISPPTVCPTVPRPRLDGPRLPPQPPARNFNFRDL